MLIEAQDIMAPYIEILDLDSGEFIKQCLRANLETGEYEIFDLDKPLVDNSIYTEKRKGNLVLVYKGGDDYPLGVEL